MKRMLDKREILFKAKRISDGKWVEGHIFNMMYDGKIVCCIEDGYINANDYGDIIGDWYFIDEETICQFIGLKDKNGNKIFEGDILNIIGSNKPGLPAPVVFLKEQCKFVMFRSAYNHINLSEFDTEKEVEIVGGVYE